jgi:hypothetical protein
LLDKDFFRDCSRHYQKLQPQVGNSLLNQLPTGAGKLFWHDEQRILKCLLDPKINKNIFLSSKMLVH